MSDKVEATDKEREKHIKKDMQEIKQRYDTVNKNLWNVETRMVTMSKDQAERSCAIQSKLDALLRNSTAQDKLVANRPQGARVDFIEPLHRKNRVDFIEKTGVYPGLQQAEGQGVQDHHEG